MLNLTLKLALYSAYEQGGFSPKTRVCVAEVVEGGEGGTIFGLEGDLWRK